MGDELVGEDALILLESPIDTTMSGPGATSGLAGGVSGFVMVGALGEGDGDGEVDADEDEEGID